MNKFLSFLIGCGTGAVVAMLLSPRSGQEIRGAISSKVREGYGAVSERIEREGGIRGVVQKGIQQGRNVAQIGRRRMNESVEAGRNEYWKQRQRESMGT